MASPNFSKLTPEQVYRGTNNPNWVSINGGFVNGNLTITGNETVTGITTVNSLVATTANAGALTVSGATTLTTVIADEINQGKVGFPSFVLGPTLSGTVINPLPINTTAQCSVGMLCTDVTYSTPGFVTFSVSNNYPFYVGQIVTVANTTNWNGNYPVVSVGSGIVRCSTTNTSASEPTITAIIFPLYTAGVYNVSGICKVTQNSAPTPGSTTEGIAFGFGVGTAPPSNYTLAPVQATTNPINTITSGYGQATFPIVGTVRCTTALSRLWLVVNTGAQTGSYSVAFSQFTVTPIGVFRA